MWLVGVSGGVVFIEPAPYEFMVILAMVVFAATGLSLRLAHLPLIFLLIAYNAGYLIGVLPVTDLQDTVQWTAVSMFMSVTTLFFALALVDDTERRLDLLLKGYLAIAVIVSIFGIITYFHLLPGSDTFIFAGRSRSTFKDPNVLGAFLVLPARARRAEDHDRAGGRFLRRGSDVAGAGDRAPARVLARRLGRVRGRRRADAGASASSPPPTGRERRRIVLVAILGTVALAAMLVVILSVPQVVRAVPGARELHPGATTPAGSADSAATSSAPSSRSTTPGASGRCSSRNTSPRTPTTRSSTPSWPAAGSAAPPISR